MLGKLRHYAMSALFGPGCCNLQPMLEQSIPLLPNVLGINLRLSEGHSKSRYYSVRLQKHSNTDTSATGFQSLVSLCCRVLPFATCPRRDADKCRAPR